MLWRAVELEIAVVGGAVAGGERAEGVLALAAIGQRAAELHADRRLHHEPGAAGAGLIPIRTAAAAGRAAVVARTAATD